MKTKETIDRTWPGEFITAVGTKFIEVIVLDFLSKSFDYYNKRDFNRRHFRADVFENTYSTAAIVLTVLGIEAYRNRIFCLERKKVGKYVFQDLSEIIGNKDRNFPKQDFQGILSEIFVVRDVIVHNHIYEVKVFHNRNGEMLGHRQKLLEGYGDTKHLASTNPRTKKTNLLKFNIQPLKIGFEDLYKLLAFFDVFVGILRKIFGDGHIPFRLLHKINEKWEDNLSKVLSHYYEQIPNEKYVKQFDSVIKGLKKDYSTFLPKGTWVVNNFCPKCGTFGLHKPGHTNCRNCDFEPARLRF